MFTDVSGALFNTASFGAGPQTIVTFGAWVFGWELWQGPMEVLSRRWRTVGFDQRGSGETICQPAEITLEAMTSDVFGIMDALAIDRCVLGAESRGMIVAVRAALERPSRFAGLVLVSGQAAMPPASKQSEAFLERVQSDLPAVIANMVERFFPEPNVEHLKRWSRHIGSRSSVPMAVAAQRAVLGADVRPLLREVAVPTLLIHGALDEAVPLDVARENAAALPGSKLVVLDGVGHGPTVVRPREVADAIEDYFGTPASSP